MKNKSMISLWSVNTLLIFGTTVALLVSTSSSQMISASVGGGTPGSNTSNSNQGAGSANKCTPYKPCGSEDQPNNAEQSLGSSQGGVPNSSSSGASSNSNQQAIDHINQAQSSLQNGDTEGAQTNLDLAKKALGCSPFDPAHC
jgi:hypothetical protein